MESPDFSPRVLPLVAGARMFRRLRTASKRTVHRTTLAMNALNVSSTRDSSELVLEQHKTLSGLCAHIYAPVYVVRAFPYGQLDLQYLDLCGNGPFPSPILVCFLFPLLQKISPSRDVQVTNRVSFIAMMLQVLDT